MARWGGMVNWDNDTQIPNGAALVAQNCQFLAESVKMRYGLRHAVTIPGSGDVTGFDFLTVLNVPNVAQISALYSDAGALFQESPVGSGAVVPLVFAGLPAGGFMQTAKAYNRIFMAFSSLKKSLGTSLVYDSLTQAVYPITANTVGARWVKATTYQIGDLVTTDPASTGGGKWFRCIAPGKSGTTEPRWPLLPGFFTGPTTYAPASVTETTGDLIQWIEWTPAIANYVPPLAITYDTGSHRGQPGFTVYPTFLGGGTIPAGKDVYIVLSLVCEKLQQEIKSGPIVLTDSPANSEVQITFRLTATGGPVMPDWMSIINQRPDSFYPLELNVYVAAVNTGTTPPVPSAYRVAFSQLPLSQSSITISSIPSAALPLWTQPLSIPLIQEFPGAQLFPATAVQSNFQFIGEQGARNWIIVYYDATGTPSPVDPSSVMAFNFIGGPPPVAFIPPTPYLNGYVVPAFTVVGAGVAGPFNWITDTEPANPFFTNIQSISGVSTTVTAVLDTVAGLAVGDEISIQGQATIIFNGTSAIGSIDSGTNTVTWANANVVAATPGTANSGTVTVQQILSMKQLPSQAGLLLNFDDTSLPEGEDVTMQLNAIQAPPSIDIAYIPSTRRMAYVSDLFPSTAVFSEPDQPGVVDGDNAVLGIETSNGQIMCAVRELQNGVIVAIKRRGGYQIVPNEQVPAGWGINRLWAKHGPASGRAVGKTENNDSLLDFVVFVDPDSGLYKFPPTMNDPVDGLDWLSKELTKGENATWNRVNRAAAEQIAVVIDDVAKVIKVSVPLDGATSPSHVLSMDYFNGWQEPLMMTVTGNWVYSREARRWSLDPIPTMCMGLADRTFANPNSFTPPLTQEIIPRQLLYGIPNDSTNAFLDFQQPGVYDDNGNAIDQQYKPALAQDEMLRILRWAMTTGRAIGSGNLYITAVDGDGNFLSASHLISLLEDQSGNPILTRFKVTTRPPSSEQLTFVISNSDVVNGTPPVPGDWFEMQEFIIWYKTLWPSRNR